MMQLKEAMREFISNILGKHTSVTYEELDAEFRKATKYFYDNGALKLSRDIKKLHGLPLEWEVISTFQRFVELDSRKAWSKVILPEGQDRFTYDFIVRRGFYKDDYDTVKALPFIYLVFEVKSHKSGGITLKDLRQLEDWVGRLNRKHQQNLTNDHLKELINVIPNGNIVKIDNNERINISEVHKFIPILFPYKGVFVVNHAWQKDDRGAAFGANEIQFAKERGFCLMTFADLLIFKQAIEDYEIDSWFFLEEMWLVDGVLDLDHFSGYNLRKKYG